MKGVRMEGKGLDLTALKAEARRLREAGDVKGAERLEAPRLQHGMA